MHSSPDDIAQLLKSDESSIVYIQDGKLELAYNEDKLLPIASVMKVLIAIEYAEQVTSHKINPDELVNYRDVLNYDIPHVDGEMQRDFEHAYNTKQLTLNDIAKGMIKYSANANTDYLIDRLKSDNINQRIKTLGLDHHDKVMPLIGGMVMASQLDDDALKKDINQSTLFKKVIESKDEFIQNIISTEKVLKDFDKPRQQYWSDHLTRASAKTYAELMDKINHGTFGDKQTKILRALLEQRTDAFVKSRYTHYGYKAGSTLKLLNGVYYTTDKKGHTQAMAFYLNDLNPWEMYKAQQAFRTFRNKIFEDKAFRTRLIKELHSKK